MHLLNCVCLLYDITTDFTGTLYIGFTLRWDYIRRIVYLSISGYRKDFVSILYSLASWTSTFPVPMYRSSIWCESVNEQAARFLARRIQEAVIMILYHAWGLKSPTLVVLSMIGTEQTIPTEFTGRVVFQLLNYWATYPNPILRFCASDMVLYVYSGTFYLSVHKGRSSCIIFLSF